MALVIEEEKELGHLKIRFFGLGFPRSRGEIARAGDFLGKIPVTTRGEGPGADRKASDPGAARVLGKGECGGSRWASEQ